MQPKYSFVNQILTSALLVFGGASASATATLYNYSNDFQKVETPDTLTVNIYAGMTFQPIPAGADNSHTFDSCAAAVATVPHIAGFSDDGAYTTNPNGLACNSHQIYPSLNFTVTMSSDQAATYGTSCTTNLMVMQYGGTTIINPQNQTAFTPGVANQQISATWNWSQICGALSTGSDATCKTGFNNSMKIGFNPQCATAGTGGTTTGTTVSEGITFNFRMRYVGSSPAMNFGCAPKAGGSITTMPTYEPFCDFHMYPGDSKAYLYDTDPFQLAVYNTAYTSGDNTQPGALTGGVNPDQSGMKTGFFRVYYEAVDATVTDASAVTLASPSHDFPLDPLSNSISDKRVMDLNNGQKYVFIGASVDQGGNVEYFMDPTANTNTNSEQPLYDSSTLGHTEDATPAEVYGLLADKKCFIATAAYGSSDAGDVLLLRRFRNRFLMTWPGGRAFVNAYYTISPPIANLIAKNSFLRLFVRDSLKPFVFTASMMLKFGFMSLVALMMLAATIFFGVVSWLQRGHKA